MTFIKQLKEKYKLIADTRDTYRDSMKRFHGQLHKDRLKLPESKEKAEKIDALKQQKERSFVDELRKMPDADLEDKLKKLLGVNKWKNYGDKNPAEATGCWIRWNGKNVDFLFTDYTEEEAKRGYDVISSSISPRVLKEHLGGLVSFADATHPDDFDTRLMYLLTAWIPYHNGDTKKWIVPDKSATKSFYAEKLKETGIGKAAK